MQKSATRRRALITGASRGIGYAIARYFADHDYDLYLVARNPATLNDVAANFRHHYGERINVEALAIDLSDSAALSAAFAPWRAQLPSLDVLVNSAGIFHFGSSQLPAPELTQLFATNVIAVHQLCSLFRPALCAASTAHIFNVSSIAGVEGFAPIAGYAASKHALTGYGDSLAKDCLRDNIRVTTLCPDVVHSDMSAASGLAPEQMIQTGDICASIDLVLNLSPSALIDRLVIKCKIIAEMNNVRQ